MGGAAVTSGAGPRLSGAADGSGGAGDCGVAGRWDDVCGCRSVAGAMAWHGWQVAVLARVAAVAMAVALLAGGVGPQRWQAGDARRM